MIRMKITQVKELNNFIKEGSSLMYNVEWDDDFGGTASIPWTNDKEFIINFYNFLKDNFKTGVKIVEKVCITNEFINEYMNK
jgi:hypothetical protein